jgi:hypothetical protein
LAHSYDRGADSANPKIYQTLTHQSNLLKFRKKLGNFDEGTLTIRKTFLNHTMRISHSILALSLMTVALAPLSATAQNTKPYPTETIEGFTNSCTSQGSSKGVPTETMRQICTCSIEALQQTYTYEQFAKIDTDLGAGKPAPAEMNTIVEDCVKEVVSK